MLRRGAAATLFLGAVTASFALATGNPAIAQSSTQKRAVVFCHDSARGIVQRKLVGDCEGEAVSPERAEQIRAERIERRRKALSASRKPAVANRKLRGIGTGFFVTQDGKLVTNNHVVEGCAAISVATPDGRQFKAVTLDTLPSDDLALVSVPVKAVASARFLDSPILNAGEAIALIGYPDQGLPPIKPLITKGTLGASGITGNGRPRFQINADVRRGNSGGPVVDAGARVIGVVFAKIDTVGVYERTGKRVRFVGVVIDNAAVLEFLGRNKVAFTPADAGTDLSPQDLEQRLRAMVARVECWK